MRLITTFLVCGCLLGIGESLRAQNYYKAVQQAHRDSAQNDAEQQRIANASGSGGGSAAPGGAAPAAPADPALQATMKNVSGLQSDFATLTAAGGTVDSSQKVGLLNDLSQASQGANKASSDSIKKLVNDLSTALAGQKKLTVPQQKRLAQEIHALFNSAHLKDVQQQNLLNDVQKILTDAGAPLDSAVDVVTDLKDVVAQTK